MWPDCLGLTLDWPGEITQAEALVCLAKLSGCCCWQGSFFPEGAATRAPGEEQSAAEAAMTWADKGLAWAVYHVPHGFMELKCCMA